MLIGAAVPGLFVGALFLRSSDAQTLRIIVGTAVALAAAGLAFAGRYPPKPRLRGINAAAGFAGGVLGTSTSLTGVLPAPPADRSWRYNQALPRRPSDLFRGDLSDRTRRSHAQRSLQRRRRRSVPVVAPGGTRRQPSWNQPRSPSSASDIPISRSRARIPRGSCDSSDSALTRETAPSSSASAECNRRRISLVERSARRPSCTSQVGGQCGGAARNM